MKKLMIPLIIVAALIVGAGAMFFILGGFDNFANGDDKPTPSWEPETQDAEWSCGDKFTSNLKGSLSNYVVVNIVLVVEGTEEDPDTIDQVMTDLTDMLDSKQAVIRDTIFYVLRSVSLEDARADGAQNKIKRTITDTLNAKLEIDNITGVLFDSFLVS
jgi:flagellar basal body-associated protein FliL